MLTINGKPVDMYGSDSDQLSKNTQLFNAIRKRPKKRKPLTEEDRLEKIKQHLGNGADINAMDKNNRDNTVLHLAIKKNYKIIVEFLLQQPKVNIHISNIDGKTAQDLAQDLNNQNIIPLFTKYDKQKLFYKRSNDNNEESATRNPKFNNNWMTERVGTSYLAENRKNLFQEIQESSSLGIIDSFNKSYFADSSQEYTFETYILNEFLLGDKQVLELVCQDLFLGHTRIVQAFRELQVADVVNTQEYTRNYGHIFLYLSQLGAQYFRSKLYEVLKDTSTLNLIVIECNSQSQETEELYSNLDGVLTSNKNKKVIFLNTKDNNALAKKFATDCIKYKSEFDSSSFNDLTKESQEKLLEREIILQGEKIRLNKLIDKSDKSLKKIIDVKTLIQLITNKEIEIGSKPPGTSDLEGAYSKLFKAKDVEIKTFIDKLLEKLNDIYIISGIPGSDKVNDLIKFLNSNIEESKVNDLKGRIGVLNQQDIGVINQKIQVADDQFKEQDFKQICHNNSDTKIYWINLKNEGNKSAFMLEQIYNPDFYLEGQTFNNKVLIEKNVQEQLGCSTLSEIFIINVKDESDITRWLQFPNDEKQRQFEENCRNNKIKFLTSEDDIEFTFLELIKRNKAKTFHLLKFEQNQLIWCKTHGSLDNLSKYKCKEYGNIKYLIGEDDLIRDIKEKKVSIIAGNPGMGKSTTLTKLFGLKYVLQSGIEESIITSHWVFRINLKDHLEIIRNIDFSNSNLKTEIVQKITEFLSQVDKNLYYNFAKNLLSMALINEHFTKPLLIAFDGFDEVSNKVDRDKIILLLTRLKDTTKAKFWITTRLYHKDTLEDALSIFAIKLHPMNDLTTKKFIIKYLSGRLNLMISHTEFKEIFDNTDKVIENYKLQKYIKAFLSKMHEVFKGDVSKFTGIPLQLYLMLEGSTEHFKEWARDDNLQSPDFSYLGNDLWEVYEHFVDRRYETYFKKTDVIVTTLDRYHKDLAKSLLLKSKPRNDLKKFEDIVLSAGIVRSNASNIDFVHPNFREYFAAKVLIHWIGKWTEENEYVLTNPRKQKYFLKKILLKPRYQIIRAFLNAKFLKKKIANIQWEENFYDKSILFQAVQENNVGIARFIFDNFKDAKVTVTGNCGNTLLHSAANSGHLKMVQFLVNEQNANVKATDNNGKTVLYCAVESRNYDMIQFLVVQGANVNITNKDDNGILHYAAASDNWDIVQFLVARDANIGTIDDYGNTVLHRAAMSGHVEIVIFLVTKGANVHATNKDGTTVLNGAAGSGNYDMIPFLVAKGANVQATNKDGITVLHRAAGSGNYDMIPFLLAKGANINAIDNYGNTVLHWAAKSGNLDMVQFLVAQGINIGATNKDGFTVLHWAALHKKLYTVEYLVDKGVNVEATTKDGKTVLHLAAESDNSEMVQFLMAKGANVNAANKDGNTVLHRVVESGNHYMVQFLMNKGANVEATNNDGNTVLHLAVESNNLEMVQFLIAKGANVDAANNHGNTSLYWAAIFGNYDMIQCLVAKGANVNAANTDGNTILYQSATSSNLLIVQYLVAKGANVDATNKNGNTVLHRAVESGNLDIVQFLVANGANIDTVDIYGNTVLHKAAKSNNEEMVLFLVSKGANVNATNKDGITVLHRTAGSGNYDMVLFLVAKGSNIDAIDKYGNTVLHWAAKSGNYYMVQFLVVKGVNVDVTNKDGYTVLHWAAVHRKIDIVEYLVAKGANVDTANKDGNTILHKVVASGNYDIAQFLVNKGASVEATNKNGDTVLHLVAKSAKLNMIQFLVAKGANVKATNKDGNTLLHLVAKSGNLDIVQFLVDKGANINATNDDGDTVLHCSAKSGNVDMVQFLVDEGANVDATDKNGNAILFWPARFQDYNMVQCLVHKGANVNATDKDGNTILHCASELGYLTIVKYLVSQGANINALNKDGNTVLHCAAESGNLDLVQFLVAKGANIDTTDNYGNTVLHNAVISENVNMVQFLVDEGANVNATNKNGITILYRAYQTCDSDIIQFLIANGANLDG